MKAYIEFCNEAELISKALQCLENKLRYASDTPMNNSRHVGEYIRLQLAEEKEEVFAVLFLDYHFRLIAFEKLFRGTINEANVYPRKIVIRALEHNAAKIIIAHNHLSGRCNPSGADIALTNTIRQMLNIVDVELVDHIIASHTSTYSFAEKDMLLS